MALLNRRPQPSYYMPKFWPASQILGQILGEQIESVPADKIVGLIVTDQIASLAALKIEGKITSEQIETLAATQITGELTDEQIAEINAAKIVGQLTDSQLGGIAAAKIIGQLANGQIVSLEAGKVTGQLTNAQIKELEAFKITGQLSNAQIKELEAKKISGQLTNAQIAALEAAKITGKLTSAQILSVEAALISGQLTNAQIAALEAAKITGQLTNTQLLGLSSAKIEGLLSSEQIASLAVAKLVGQISNSQIAAGAVTAGKISVAELSAISVNAGVIESGTFIGVTFRTKEEEFVLNANGIAIVRGPNEEVESKVRAIQWLKEKAGEVLGQVYSWGGTETGNVQLIAWPPGRTKKAILSVTASKSGILPSSVTAQAIGNTGNESAIIINDRGSSSFIQYQGNGKHVARSGAVSAAGAVAQGAGFTVTKLGTGNYRITLTAALSSVGSMFVEMNDAFTQLHKTTGPSTNTWDVLINGFKGLGGGTITLEASDQAFSFFIIQH